MKAELFYKSQKYPEFDKHDKRVSKFDYYDLIDFAESYHEALVNKNNVLHRVVWRMTFTIMILISLMTMSILIFPDVLIPSITFNIGWFGHIWWRWYEKA